MKTSYITELEKKHMTITEPRTEIDLLKSKKLIFSVQTALIFETREKEKNGTN
jgi:hypothetical protein